MKMIKKISKSNRKLIITVGVIVFLLIVSIGFYILGDIHGVQNMTIKRVTPTQIANAMKNDDFYGQYRENTLIMNGQVASVSDLKGIVRVSFQTDSVFNAYCDLNPDKNSPPVGQTITVLSEGGPAQRLPNAVLLTNCMIL